jgi:hypothetical protein
MQSVAKSEALIRDLANKLQIRYAGSATINFVRQANDAQGWPMLFLSVGGNEAEGQPVILIRIKNVDAVSKDIFGNQTFAYAPHTLEFAYELAAANKPIPLLTDIAPADFESIKTGVQFQLKILPNGTQVDEASIDAAAPSVALDELYWPTKLV